MTVTINDKAHVFDEGTSLAQAFETLGLPAMGVATALNGTVIPGPKRAETILSDGDKIVIIKAFYGG